MTGATGGVNWAAMKKWKEDQVGGQHCFDGGTIEVRSWWKGR